MAELAVNVKPDNKRKVLTFDAMIARQALDVPAAGELTSMKSKHNQLIDYLVTYGIPVPPNLRM